MFEELHAAVLVHTGLFLCSEIRNPANEPMVSFRHAVGNPVRRRGLPDVPGFEAFYATFGSLTLYLDDASGDSAFHIAAPEPRPRLF